MSRAEPPDALLDRRSEPGPRAVLGDWLAEQGRNLRWLGVADIVDDAADADAAADAADAADADSADADVDDAAAATAADDAAADADVDDAAAAAAAAADDAADADAAADADDLHQKNKQLTRYFEGEPHVYTGLVLVKFPRTGYYGRGLLLAGWCRRKEGDVWELVGAQPVWRVHGSAVPIAQLAAEGLTKHHNHGLGFESKLPEPFHVLIPRRWVPCVVEAWPEKPKPAGWAE